MGLTLLIKKIALLFLLISAVSLAPTSIAGGQPKFVNHMAKEIGAAHEKVSGKQLQQAEVMTCAHERVLRANTKDYGKYDPAPRPVKPPFKVISN